ncbi:MAG: bifunctional proline dehydrogenase/L-glutamate gamma-semialdehyde dehydrogenase PutA [Neisseriaceae bacterium]|nr:bifunctional proline dehydrogenase/L-glutamate gamma-semialdehyde dehydrogenase PutA [Neisseriaceae bacterium]
MFHAIDVLRPDFLKQPLSALWDNISPLYCVDEDSWLTELLPLATPSDAELTKITQRTRALIETTRADKNAIQLIDALLLEYSLDTREGVLLMCVAEALLRIPDVATADALIYDKLSVADWQAHLKQSKSTLVNTASWGLALTGKVLKLSDEEQQPASALAKLTTKLTEPVIRHAMLQAMKIMGHQFVLGRTMEEALKKGRPNRAKNCTYSFDMLGEAALTAADAQKYYNDYRQAIQTVGQDIVGNPAASPTPTVSIKLSALHPRYEVANTDRVLDELFDTVLTLLKQARTVDVGITIDAEEADRLELSLQLFEKLYRDPAVQGWGKFGLVIQAYSKRALPVLTWLAALAAEQGDVIPLRLVKGAYWDTEIKISQQRGLPSYPVFTRKEATDVSYLACARFLLSEPVRGLLYPQFAGHNAQTISAIAEMASHQDFEFQRLHGMGAALHLHAMAQHGRPVRIYAPVGSHKDLLPYLVRRLLENGANSSFVHQLGNHDIPVAELSEHPVQTLLGQPTLHNARIALPPAIFGAKRKNSLSVNIDIESSWAPMGAALAPFLSHQWQASSLISGQAGTGEAQPVTTPYNHQEAIGQVIFAQAEDAQAAIAAAKAAFPSWRDTPASTRAEAILRFADLIETHYAEFIALCHREAGKTVQDCIDEIREAIDFCRYYAQQASDHFSQPYAVVDHQGQSVQKRREGRGVMVCISPWNFPLAIFLGQITAALAAGNTVVAKPAEQTSLIAHRAIGLLHEAGVPTDAVHLVLGTGKEVGSVLTHNADIAGVVFTGSTQTAQHINRALAASNTDVVRPLVAETGGQNAMIVDSTALPEQVVRDVVRSSFASAGQRCSALRVLYVQEDVAERMITLIKGSMAELKVGNPVDHSTDVGPVIDKTAQDKLQAHIASMSQSAQLIAQTKLPEACQQGTFVAPTAFEIKHMNELSEEQFGPILHIIRYRAADLDKVIDAINQTGYGLTLGVHSRNEHTYQHVDARARVGNSYINRDQVGAVVGVQPFGGQGLSGTGPKAGGPRYLLRFTHEVVA